MNQQFHSSLPWGTGSPGRAVITITGKKNPLHLKGESRSAHTYPAQHENLLVTPFDSGTEDLQGLLQEFRMAWPGCSRHKSAVCEACRNGIRIFPQAACMCTSSENSYARQHGPQCCEREIIVHRTHQTHRIHMHRIGRNSISISACKNIASQNIQPKRVWWSGRGLTIQPASTTTGFTAGYAVHLLPFKMPAAARISWPWQIEAIGLCELSNSLTKFRTSSSRERYSGARPPGTTNAS